MKLASENRFQRFRRHWRLSWKDNLTTAVVVSALVLVIWGISALAKLLFGFVSRTHVWNSLPLATRFVIGGTALIISGGAFLGVRLKRRGYGIVTLLDLRLFLGEIASIVGGIALLIRAAYV